MALPYKGKAAKRVVGLTILFLVIELLDELVDGVRGAAWPLIRQDLDLSYFEIGMVLTLPSLIASMIEPVLGIWGDIGPRRHLILGGGVGFAIALYLIAQSQDFGLFLTGFVILYPASGSFVSLSQASLMDLDTTRHEQNMARWALAGSLGNVLGPLILVGAIAWHGSWRGAFLALAALTGGVLALLWNYPIPSATSGLASDLTGDLAEDPPTASFRDGLRSAIAALRRSAVLRWLTLLQFSDLMLDVLRGFIALYFVDVLGTTPAQASFAIALWLGFGLLGDFLLIPLLERVRGLAYLRISTSLVLCLYPAFLLVPSLTLKLIILSGLGFLNAGWYSILQGQLYSAMPGQSGTVMTLNNIFGIAGGLAPLVLGLVAQQIGLEGAMWILLISPIALLIGLLR